MRVPSKILIIRFSSIGDIVLTWPVVRFLREQFPGAQIDFLTKKRYAELLRWNEGLTNVILFNEGEAGELTAVKKRIRGTRYDLIVDLHNSLRSRYLRLFSGARKVRVFRKEAVKRFLLVAFKRNLFNRVRSVAERYADTVRMYGDPDATVEMSVPQEVVHTVTGLVRSGTFSASDRLVGFAPSATHFTKRWPMERFVRLGVALAAEERVKIALFGSAEEADYCADLAHLINSGAASHCAESFAGKLSLVESAAGAGLCALFISNDTGLMHMAAARGVPLVAVFGSSVKEFGFTPQGERSVVMETRGLECRPCSHIGRSECPEKHFRCMNDITVDSVLAEARRLLRDKMRPKTTDIA